MFHFLGAQWSLEGYIDPTPGFKWSNDVVSREILPATLASLVLHEPCRPPLVCPSPPPPLLTTAPAPTRPRRLRTPIDPDVHAQHWRLIGWGQIRRGNKIEIQEPTK